ncbi:MAG: type I-E CRISPR-associated protein Cas7/Cse4/CasC [bacterium]
MKGNRLYLDIHVLQNTPPSCINRDDTGSPKTAVYGGVTRARVSSQAWKRAVRLSFSEILGSECVGVRTKRIIPMVAEEIANINPMADAMALARRVLEAADIGIKAKDDKKSGDKANKADLEGTGALFFMSRQQAAALAEYAAGKPEKAWKPADIKHMLAMQPSVDMALFGRMVASDPSLNVDAACQVAHSISTHAVRNEFDYFTAVDDCSPVGAGYIDTVEFNASVLYRYATVNLRDLASSLGRDDAVRAALAFAEAFICSMPTGKQNTFANRTLPDVVYIALRGDQPVNLVGAFEKPVRGYEGSGLLEPSVRALQTYAKGIYDKYGMPPVAEFDLGGEITGQAAGGLKNMLSALEICLDEKRGELE